MKKPFSLTIILTALLIISCNHEVKTKKEVSSEIVQQKEYIFISDDGKWKFSMINDPETENGIILTSVLNGKSYHLKQVIAASGVRYSNMEGIVFWTKGESFLWMKNDSLITSGTMEGPE